MASGIQNKNEIKIDLVYTKLGRFYKMTNDPRQRITKFAFSDDGINYNLYDPTKPESERGKMIEETPQFDAWTDETALMRNKLLSLDRDTTILPSIEVSPEIIEIHTNKFAPSVDRVNTVNINYGVPTPNGFKITLVDTNYLYINEPPNIQKSEPIPVTGSGYGTSSSGNGSIQPTRHLIESEGNTFSQTYTVSGSQTGASTTSFNIHYNASYAEYTNTDEPHETKVIIESNDGLGKKEIPIIIHTI